MKRRGQPVKRRVTVEIRRNGRWWPVWKAVVADDPVSSMDIGNAVHGALCEISCGTLGCDLGRKR